MISRSHSMIKQRYHPSYNAIIARAVGVGAALPSYDCMNLQDTLLRNLVASGDWVRMNDLYVMADDASTITFGTINWKNPAMLAVSNVGAGKRNKIGIQGNSSNRYMRISNNLTTLAADSYFSCKEYDNVIAGALDSAVLFGGRAGAGSNLIRCAPRSSSNTFRWTLQENEANSVASSDSSGWNTLVGSASAASAYKNTTLLQTTDGLAGNLFFEVLLLGDLVNDVITSLSSRTAQIYYSGSNTLEATMSVHQGIFNNYLTAVAALP